MNIGIVCAGAIAQFLLKKINQEGTEEMKINSIFVRNRKKYEHLEQQHNLKLYTELDAFLESNVDIVVEAANIEAVHALFPAILRKKDVIIISIGALADTSFFQKMNDLAHTYEIGRAHV